MSSKKTDAIVLKRRDFQEHGRIITVFSPVTGWFDVLAQGLKKPNNQWVGALEPFSWVQLDYTEGHTFARLISASLKTVFLPAGTALERISAGYVISELIVSLLPEESPQPAIYALALQAFAALASTSPALVISWFRLHLLTLLGFAPNVTNCSSGTEPLSLRDVAGLDISRGGLICRAHSEGRASVATLTPREIKLFVLLLERPIDHFSQLQLPDQTAEALHRAIYALLCYHTERSGQKAAAFFVRVGGREKSS